ncbi:D-aspartate ligase [Bremerella volcania]|uniref:D-aspartate ligase n=1 Tax=Bremerella volcania TaxID=2527984 RepID=A0A518C945_9BACT|nr:carboxylate--amine ligase [Bremerella volcania]QDU75748.1 D-aspartate ligase [Bremerella volcania]
MSAIPPAVSKPSLPRETACSMTTRPPAIIIGGGANALSIARSLGRQGIQVWVLNYAHSPVRYSRFATWLTLDGASQGKSAWGDFLLGSASDDLEGAVLIPASDVALELLIEHYAKLKRKFRLDLFVPDAQASMLNKLETYQAAARVGVPTPKFWLVDSKSSVMSLQDELVFPLLVKPLYSHRFVATFGVKFLVAETFEQLKSAWDKIDEDHEVMLVEKIPGPDSQLCSYYTYIDEDGKHLFQFTKRIIRRFPPEMGVACRHVTAHIPELVEPATKLFAEAGLRGLANVEFKQDPRDGVLKLIECNARITAANILLDRCGYDLASFLYQRVVQGELPQFGDYPDEAYLWNPVDDLRAFLQLRIRGELSFWEWIRSISKTNVTLQIFQWSDPLPAWMDTWHRLRRVLKRK